MKLDANMTGRIIRGVAGAALVIAGIKMQNFVWLLGAYLIMGAFGLGCGFGNSSCAVNLPKETAEEKQGKLNKEN